MAFQFSDRPVTIVHVGGSALGHGTTPEHGRDTYVAEQAWTGCASDVVSRLLEVDSATWLLPFLRLAGGDGEQAGGRVLSDLPNRHLRGPAHPRTLLEEVEIGDRADHDEAGTVRRSLLWRTAGFDVLFRRFDGSFSATSRPEGSVLALEGRYEQPASLDALPNGRLAGRRAAEAAVRSLLGHLRAALEDPDLEEMLA